MATPKLRFKAFDGDWGKKKFSEQFNFHNTNSYSRALLAEQGEIMNIHYGDIHTKFSMLFDVKEEAVPFLSSEIDTNKIAENQFLQVGDLVIADASEDYKDIGKAIEVINLDNKKVVAGLHTYIARPVERCAIGFNGYLMQTFEVREQIKKLATGISVLGISKTNLGKVELKIPCLAEQTKIASFLSAVDEKISQLTQKHQLLSQYKQGMMQKLFSQQLRFKADDGSEFGEWEDKKLGEISKTFSGGTPQSSNKSFYEGTIPFIKSGEISKNTTEQCINDLALEKSSAKLVKKGDLLYALYGATSGQVAISQIDGAINQAVLCIRSELNTKYLLNFLLLKKEEILTTYLQGGQGNLSASILKEIYIPTPCLEEQTKIANFSSSIDQKIEVVAQQIEQAKTWKKGLLLQMFV